MKEEIKNILIPVRRRAIPVDFARNRILELFEEREKEISKEILEEIKQFVISESGKSGRKEIIEFIEAKLKELK